MFSSIVHSAVDSYTFLVVYILLILARLFPCVYVNCLSDLFDFCQPSIRLYSFVMLVQFLLILLLSLCGSDLSSASVTKLKSLVIIRLFWFFIFLVCSLILFMVSIFSFCSFGMYTFIIV